MQRELTKEERFREDTALHGKNHVSGKVFFLRFLMGSMEIFLGKSSTFGWEGETQRMMWCGRVGEMQHQCHGLTQFFPG